MTPLQQAAQALIVHWTNARLDDFRMVGCVQNLRTALADEQAQPANSRIASLYEELRKATDEGNESMTHDDALKQIACWQNKEQAQAVEPTSTKTEQIAGAISKHIPSGYVIRGYTEKEMLSYALEFSLEYNKQLIQRIIELESNQVKQGKTPMTDEQVLAIGKELGKKCRLGGNPNIDFDYARAIEAYHGIKECE